MKKIILSAAILFAFVVTTKNSQAQVKVGVNINIGSQPAWGPVGYDYVDYYYLPDIDAYYYVPSHQFVYLSNGRWIFASSLPVAYRRYDLYSGYKVVVNEPRPYLHANVFRERYASYKGRRNEQVVIRHDNGNHNGWYKHDERHEHEERHGHGHGRKD
jgi:hypothetical protein